MLGKPWKMCCVSGPGIDEEKFWCRMEAKAKQSQHCKQEQSSGSGLGTDLKVCVGSSQRH